ncbi:obscurin isoform X8 [Daktulosphaira vitifoliae]|uniref:obscurin isoform X8 n=1 Tax=Daktulosphaira vitifoliae TaxID=58002 RepID=UPI0021AAE878|nr:obscurin isoform X8 [Daktulosphaira vitifoliae]
MSSYCRITGRSRGLPKPNYFPLLPPISPADAKRFCRITGKSYGLPAHHYIPVLMGRKKILTSGSNHEVLNGYRYVFPVIEGCIELSEVLKCECDSKKRYVYAVDKRRCSLIFPNNLEIAVRDGNVKDIMFSETSDTILLKLRKGNTVEIEVKDVDISDLHLLEGEGFRIRPKKKLKSTIDDWRRKIFEDKEKEGEAELEQEELKSKRLTFSTGYGKLKTPIKSKFAVLNTKSLKFDEIKNIVKPSVKKLIDIVKSSNIKLDCDIMPDPITIEPSIIDLSTAFPGVIHQPLIDNSVLTNLPINPVISSIKPLISNFTKLYRVSPDKDSLFFTELKEFFSGGEIDKLIQLNEVDIFIKNMHLGTQNIINSEKGSIKTLKLDIDGTQKYIPGQYVQTPEGNKFIPGTVLSTPNGEMFVHGLIIQSSEGPKLLPGHVVGDSQSPKFVVGQNIITRAGESFVPGQIVTINGEQKFIPGQTIINQHDISFVPGQVINTEDISQFIPGQTIMTNTGPEFIPGQFWEGNKIEFTPGQSILKENGEWEFVPGVRVGSSFVPGLNIEEEERKDFVPGRIVEANGFTSFIPGITSLDNIGSMQFMPGINIETDHGTKFVSGNILSDETGNKQFVLGRVSASKHGQIKFIAAKSIEEVVCSDEIQSGILTNNSFYPMGEKSDEVYGHMVQTAYGIEFYPGERIGLPAGKIIPGKLFRNNGVRFVPGVIVDDKFVPGQVVVTDRGEQFVPGQVIETHNGPKFVPGQIVDTENGSKFVPGQTMETKDGVKFVPGQIVETKSGPTFIPGQIIYTEEEGSRFVPGQVVNTVEGPRFVPGRVIETGDRVIFVPGQVVETTEGLKFIAPDLHDEDDGNYKFSVQGFEVPPEELKVLQPSFPQSSYFTKSREMALDSKMLEQLSLAGMSIGRHVPVELPTVDVSSLPSMHIATAISEKIELNNEATIKLAHIINRLCKLEIKKSYYGSPLLQSLINKLPQNKSTENVGLILETILSSGNSSPTAILNEIYTIVFDEGFITDLKNPNKVNVLKGIMSNSEIEPNYISEAFNEILNEIEDSKLRLAFEHITKNNVELLNLVKLKINLEHVQTEKEAIEALQWAIVNTINETSDISVNQVLSNKKSECFNRLLSDAVALAKALGLREVVSVLIDVLDDRRSSDILASDKITIDILRRLTVMRKLAERRPEFKCTLTSMTNDPHEARKDPNLRELVRESAILLFPPEVKVETSFDVPLELFSPLNSLAMEDFMVKSRKMGILLIIKNGLQAVVPREAARSVLTGEVPYSVLDEKGIHRFEPMNVLDALKLPAFTPGRYSMYKCALQRTLTEDDGTLTRDSSMSIDERALSTEEGGGEEFEILQEYESEPIEGADEEDNLILESGDRVVVLKQSKDDPSMDTEVIRDLHLDNSAAKHKMSIRPKKNHSFKQKTLESHGSLVQSVDEPTKMGYVPNSILKKIPTPIRATAIIPVDGQSLSKKDAKFNRDVVLAELVETEEEFGQDIQEVVERYLNPLERNDAPRLVTDSKDIIFNNLKQISQFHNTVLISGLKYAASEPKTMGRTFLRLERDFDKHVNYCQTEPDSQEFLEENYEVHEYFEDERLKHSDDKSLSEHLKLPIQRINDYQLLLKELIKYSLLIGEDTTDLERALELMLSIPHRFNDIKFLTNIEGYHGSIHKLGRLLKHGWYYVQDAEDSKGHQRYCFLFKSRILVCKVRRISEERSVFVLKDIIRLPEVTVKVAPDSKRVWELYHNQGEVGNYPFTFKANEDISRDQWISEIKDHQNDLREKEELKERCWERDNISICETSVSSTPVTKVEHNNDDLKVQKQKDEDLFEPLKGIELDISSEIEEGLDPIERRLAPKPLKHVEEPKRPPLTLPHKQPIFECTSPPGEVQKSPELPKQEVEVVLTQEPVIDEKTIEEKPEELIVTDPPITKMDPPLSPERSPSPAEEVIEEEPLKYIPGVSKPYFHTNIKGTNHGGIFEENKEWWDVKGEYKSERSVNNESSLEAGENAVFECQIEGAITVTWLKNNMPLPNSISHRVSITGDKENNVYKLQINKVIESDSGTYTIKAENDVGTSTSTAQLFVENITANEKKARAKANAPLFTVKLSDAELLENTHARFMIEIKGSPAPKLKFYKGDVELSQSNERIQILEVNKEMGMYEIVIPNVKPEDAGEYKVVASNKYSEDSCSCVVSVTNEKDLWTRIENHTPDIAPKFTWLKNGKAFNPEERFKVLFKDDEDSLALVFQNVKPEDAGLYTCIASTSHGKISCSAELNVQGVVKERNLPCAPKIITEVKEFETKIHSTAILEAKVYGDPEPDVVWLKNGEKIQKSTRIKTMFEENTSSIVIKNVEVDDEGEYQIIAQNEVGTESEIVNLSIKAAPKFKKNLLDYDGVTGKDISLTVEIEASPKPIVQWYKDSKTIKKSNKIKYVTDEVSGTYTLIILNTKMEDAGLYSVVASNQFSQISDACQVNLKMPPQFIGALAKEVETFEGDYVSLSVRVEGDPAPQVKWYFNDELIIPENTHFKTNTEGDVHTLLICNITRQDSGKYTCEISNESGSNTSEGKLFVKCPPIFKIPLKDTKTIEGDTDVEFTVQLNAYPKPTVKWFREEEEITETTTEFTCVEDGNNYKLIIKEAKTKLSGKYKCRATNEIGSYDSEATLTVMSQPTFKNGLKDLDIAEGGLLKLQVTCYGSPPPEIKWYKDGKEVRSGAHIKISRDTKRVENFSLTVNLVKFEDGGEYEVRATNEMGTAVTKSIVNVLAKHLTDYQDDENKAKQDKKEVGETVSNQHKVLSSCDMNTSSISESCSEFLKKEDMKTIRTSQITDGDNFLKTEKSVLIMNNQATEFSCVEISWEDSSSKSKSYYGIVEEPKDERIIPIKIDRGISIHTATDEEEEPYWIIDNKKMKNEEHVQTIKGEVKKKTWMTSTPNSDDEDNSSLNDLFLRVKKQRNDLEDILQNKKIDIDESSLNENENNNTLTLIEKLSKKYSKQENDDLEKYTVSSVYSTDYNVKISRRPISRLSSYDDQLTILQRQSLSRYSSTEDEDNRNKKTYLNASTAEKNLDLNHSSLTENIEDLVRYPKQGSISKFSLINETLQNKRESYSRLTSDDENNTFYKQESLSNIKPDSISRFDSTDDKSGLSQKKSLSRLTSVDETDKPKRGSLTRFDSTEDKSEKTQTEPLSRLTSVDETDKPKRGSISRIDSTDDKSETTQKEPLSRLTSVDEKEKTQRGSISRIDSTDDKSELSQKKPLSRLTSVDDTDKLKRGSISRFDSTDDKNEKTQTEPLSRLTSVDEKEKTQRGSISRIDSTDDKSELSQKKPLSRLTSVDETDKPKRGSISRIDSTDDKSELSQKKPLSRLTSVDDTDKLKRGSISRFDSTDDKNEKTQTEPLSRLTSVDEKEKTQRGSISRIDSTDDKSELSQKKSLSRLTSVDETDKPKRDSISRIDSTDDKSELSQKKPLSRLTSVDDTDKLKRGSISRFDSTDDKNEKTQTEPLSRLTSVDEKEKTQRGSISRIDSTDDKSELSQKKPLSRLTSVDDTDKLKRGSISRFDSTDDKNEKTQTEPLSRLTSVDEKEKTQRGSISRIDSTDDKSELSQKKPLSRLTSVDDTDKPKGGSISRIDSTDDKSELSQKKPLSRYTSVDDTDKSKRGSISRFDSTGDKSEKTQKEPLSRLTSVVETDKPKRGSISRSDSTDDKSELSQKKPLSRLTSVDDTDKPKRGSISRIDSTDDKSELSQKKPLSRLTSVDDTDKLKRGSISRFDSTDDKNEKTQTEPLSRLTSVDEKEKTQRGSISRIDSTDDKSELSQKKPLSRFTSVDDTDKSKRGSISRFDSTDDKSEKTQTEPLSRLTSVDEKEKTQRGSISRIDSTDDKSELSQKKPLSRLTSVDDTDKPKRGSISRFDSTDDKSENTKLDSKKLKRFLRDNTLSNLSSFDDSEIADKKYISQQNTELCNEFPEYSRGEYRNRVAPKFISGMDDTETFESLSHAFEVKFRGAPKPEVKWFKDGNELSKTRNIQIIESNDEECYKLILTDLRVADSGSYCCKLTNEVGETMKSANLVVQDVELLRGPKIKKPLKDLEVEKGQKVTWALTVLADPIPDVEWTCNGKEVNANYSVNFIEIANGLKECTFTMTIPSSELSDTGVYLVKAKNKFDFAECSARLDIVMRPEIEGFKDITVIPSMEAIFEAIIKAVPRPKIIWTVNGKDLSDRKNVELISEELEEKISKFKIIIGDVEPEESGEYTVKAWNKVGETTATAHLKLHTEIPSFVKLLEDKTIQEYEEVQLSVRVNGVPKPKVTWYKNNEVIIPNLRMSIHTNEEGQVKSVLTIDHFSEVDVGSFSVKAVNMVGEAETISKLTMAQIMPSFVKPFERITEAVEGCPLEIQASLIGSPRPSVKWYKDGEELKEENSDDSDEHKHLKIESNPDGTILLKIDKVEPGDCGAYKIIAVNDFGKSTTNTALVVNETPKSPVIIKHSKTIVVTEGDTLKIEAQYAAYPAPLVKWYKDGHLLYPCPRIDFIMLPNGHIALSVEKSKLEDIGTYELVVSNDLGKSSETIEVTVIPASKVPEFIIPLKDSKIVEGFPARFSVQLSGYPLPELAWFINGVPLVIDGEKIKHTSSPDGIHLIIEKTTSVLTGKISVIASNVHGKASSEANVLITSKSNSNVKDTLPLFLNELRDTTVEESSSLSLSAPFLGNPIPDVQWIKDGKILQPCNRIHFSCDGYKVGLEILDTNTGDAGKYTCILVNKLGSAVSDAQVGVRKLYQAPVFTQRFSHNQQLLNRDAKFHARVTGVPSPTILWHKNGHQLNNCNKYKIRRDGEVCSLSVHCVEEDDVGLYSCIATNRDGTATCEAQLSIAPKIIDKSRKLEPPSFMKKIGDCEIYDGMTAKFTACATGWPEPEYEWFFDTNRLYETERIRMEKEDNGLLRLKILHADSLIDSGRYKLRIFNPHGEAYCEASILFDNGLDSRSKRPVGELYKDFDRYRATGAPLPLPDPPIISRMTDRQVTLSWKPSIPISPRAPVTYLVELEEQPKGEWTTVRAGIRGNVCDINNLVPFRDYKFRIRVENNYGVSDPSPFVLTFREKLELAPPKFTPYLPKETKFNPELSPYFPKDFDIERPPHDNYAQAPRFLHQEHDTQYGVKGHNVNLFWFVYGYPKPKMQFYFDNQLIEMGGRYDSSYTRNGQATLFINKMLNRDIGVYEAVATNEHGTAKQRVRLQIAEYPKFIKRPEEAFVTLRKNCKLEARIVGVPYPEIKWYKDWQPLVNSARIQIEQVEPDVCILRIEDVIMKDAGLYSISARNLAGSISTSVAIHIEDRESDYFNNGKSETKWKRKDISDLYDIGDELGRGTQGVVYHAVERSTGKNYAAKIMHAKGDYLTKFMDNEIKIMSELSNRRIIRIHDALQSQKTYGIITELAGGGEILDVLTKHSFLTEYDVSLYIIQLLKALKYMHDFDIAHLGLTPGDILLSHPGANTIKLCDFGLSKKINRRKLEPVEYGMPEFISPEIAKGEGVDLYSDMWSIGIITHLLLTGTSLFRCVNDADTLDRVKNGSYTLSTKISSLARDFISKLLVINPNDRLDVIKALQHPWLQLGEDIPVDAEKINTDSLRNYYNNFKDWYSNSSCKNWYRRRPLSSAYSHPSKMIYPPGLKCTPSPSPEPEPPKQKKHVPCWKDKIPDKDKEIVNTDIGIIKSESHYQYGPDTYLLQLRDTNFPVRLREYMKVAGKSLTGRGGSESHLDWETPVIRERRRFTDIMDEEIEDEQKARISQYGADVYTLRRLKQEIGSRPTAHVEAEAILESRIDGQPPFFREKPQKLPIEPEKPADLMCLAVGVPKPIVQWFKNDVVLTESHRIKMLEDNDGRSILRLDPATELDLGIYKVVARNKFGQTTARARLVHAREPGIMEVPIVKEFSDTEILLQWDHPKSDGNAPILCYQLEIRENEGEWDLVAKNIDHEFWFMQNLRPYTNYEFRLAAMNRIGWGPIGPSSELVRTNFPDCPKIQVPPAMLNLQIITESGREIIGDEPHNKLDYTLEYKPTEWVEQPPIEKYRFISEIARGRFSVVLKGINTSNESIIVAKLIEVTSSTESVIKHEFNTFCTLKHERLAYLIEAFKLENAPVAVFIQEKLQGADILTYLSTKDYYSEQMIATIVTQILDGLQYLHWRGYAHLNLQPDNIVMASVRNIQVKLIDFGCAQKVSKLGAIVKTDSVLEFTAPEILCDEPAFPYSDVWSLGVIAYILLSGMSPFRGASDIETRQNITFVRYRFEYLYKDLSQEATRFLMLLFKRTPTKRPSAEECHEHRWLLPTEYMIKKREKTMFHSYKLQLFTKEYHEKRTKEATSSQKLLDVLGSRHIGLGRSNSVVDELLIFK